ncbi:MAG: NAD(P)-dependent oxidoreductase, partial [Nitrospirae bacterium]
MNILVTGTTGFIGSWLVKRLMSDHALYCLTRTAGLLPVHPQVHAIELDLADTFDAGRLPASMDAIIHLAQSRHFRKFPDYAKDIFQVNTQSTLQLLDYGRQAKIKVFVCASSGGVCGYQPRPIVETDSPELLNFYLASKYA